MNQAADPSPALLGQRLLRKSDSLDSNVLHLDHERSIVRYEWLDTRRRLCSAFLIGLIIWLLFGCLDWFVAHHNAEMLRGLFKIRAFGAVAIASGYLLLRFKEDPSLRFCLIVDAFEFTLACLLICAMCLRISGIACGYSTGLLLVSMIRATTIAQPWNRGSYLHLLMACTFPTFMIVAAKLDPEVALQFDDRAQYSAFIVQCFFLASGALISIGCADAVWRIRREAYRGRGLGRYQLKARIGRGAMGEIWLAYHLGLRKDVALKIFGFQGLHDEAAVARFEREVQVIARLSHPNTVRILDHGITEEGIHFYSMELLKGCDLQALLDREAPLQPARAIALMSQVCESLAEAHSYGIVHRDIKPSNIFISSFGGRSDYVKVLDFGLAKLTRDNATLVTLHGSVLGTPRYMAPEALAGRDVDPRSDVYSLGCVLYEMLTGRPAFSETTFLSMLQLHSEGRTPQPISALVGSAVPLLLEAIVMRCLERTPEWRYRDANELRDALAAIRFRTAREADETE